MVSSSIDLATIESLSNMDASTHRKDSLVVKPYYSGGLMWPSLLRKRTQKAKLKKPKVPKTTFSENAHEFADNTTLHALKFIGDKNISYFERAFFLIAFLTSLAVALNFIVNIYEKWSSTPVIIANSASSTLISEIPFPAVTVCNMNQALKSKVEGLDRLSIQFSILQILCNREDRIVDENFTSKWVDYEKFISESTQTCDKMLVLCRFASFTFNCSRYIRDTLTDEGRCCSFNVVDSSFMYDNFSASTFNQFHMPDDVFAVDWTPEAGYPPNLPRSYYPVKGFGAGYTMGFSMILNAEVDDYYCSSTNGPGFKVLLHSPIETPNVGNNGFSLATGRETRAVITPRNSDASDTIRSMRKEDRQCVFAKEIDLGYFRTYSRRNCEMECEARLVAKECGCILYYMPRIEGDIPICGRKQSQCFDAIKYKVQTANQDSNNCSQECMAACFDLTYDVVTYSSQLSQGSFELREQLIENMSAGYAENNLAVVHFYYIENSFRSRTKEQFVGFTEFLSNTGGLMGLFIGFSFISLVEVFYYASFRPFCARHRYEKAADLQSDDDSLASIDQNNGHILREVKPKKLLSNEHYHGKQFKTMRGFDTRQSSLNESYLP